MLIQGKVALITGASRGIGAACAEAFGRRGARLALTARSEAGLRAAGGGGALIEPADITVAGDRARLVERTLAHFGAIDILVNNAGAGMYIPSSTAPMPETRAMFDLNFFAPLELAQLVVPHMRRRGGGVIVNVGSIAGKITLPWLTLYSASKSALGAWTDGLRMELKRDGIHAMTVCPGYVDTEFQSHVLGGEPPEAMRRGRRFAISARECAEAIARGVERGSRTVVTPRSGWLFLVAERLLPSLVEYRLERMQGGES
jgi:short-subunit dehydrogenase